MSLKVLKIDQSDEWDTIVSSFKDYDVYYLSGYVKAFKIHGDGEPLLFFYEDDSIRGINVVIKRDISSCSYFSEKIKNNTWFDFVTPYGYGGWLVEGNDSKQLFSEYEDYCRKNNIVSEFVRFHPVLDNYKQSDGPYTVIALGGTIAMDLSSEEVIWANITSKNRNMIRKAQKSNVVIKKSSDFEVYKEFMTIYNSTMQKDNAEQYYYFEEGFYKSICDDLKQNARIFFAEYEGKTIAASIIIYANGRVNYHLSGSIAEYRNLAPSNLLLYEVATWGCRNGYKTFHLGGGVGSSEDNLYNFKKAFYRGEPCRFHIGKKVFNQEKYNELIELRTDLDKNSGFFPQYRA